MSKWFVATMSAAMMVAGVVPALADCSTADNQTVCTYLDGASSPGLDGGDAPDVPAPSFSGVAPAGDIYVYAGNGGAGITVGTDGGRGGDITGTSVLDIDVPNSVALPFILGGHHDFALILKAGTGGASNGGDFGDGGDSGNIVGSIRGTGGADVNIATAGGNGSGASGLARTGNAGSGGDIDVTLSGSFDVVSVSSVGGGSVGSLDDETRGHPGNGGNITVRFSGVTRQFVAATLSGNSENDATASPATTRVELDGTVLADLVVHSSYKSGAVNEMSTGPIVVTLRGGAQVDGIILNDMRTTGRLEFAMPVDSKKERRQVSAALASAGSTGSVTIGGKLFKWEGFDDLVNLITVQMPQHPGATVNVTVYDGAEPRLQRRIKCDRTGFYAEIMSDGVAELHGRNGKGKSVAIGTLTGRQFAAVRRTGWSVGLSLLGKTRIVADIADADGVHLARCIVPRR